MSSLLPLQFMGVGICSPFNSDHAECFAYVSANNVRPIRTYVSANIHFPCKKRMCGSADVLSWLWLVLGLGLGTGL